MRKAAWSRWVAALTIRSAADGPTSTAERREYNLIKHLGIALLLAAVSGLAGGAYPERPIRLLVPSSAGSGPDTVARILATRLSIIFGQQIVADNRAARTGCLPARPSRARRRMVSLLMTSGGHTSNPHIYRKLPYDTVPLHADHLFSHYRRPGRGRHADVCRAHDTAAHRSRAGFAGQDCLRVRRSRQSHASCRRDQPDGGRQAFAYPVQGGGPAIIDVIGGQVPLMSSASGPISIPHVKTGKLRGLAYTGTKRFDQIPDVPTWTRAASKVTKRSAGMDLVRPGAPADTPILTRIYEATRDGVRHPETRQALAQFNIEPAQSTPAAFARFLREDLIKYGKIIKAAGIEPNNQHDHLFQFLLCAAGPGRCGVAAASARLRRPGPHGRAAPAACSRAARVPQSCRSHLGTSAFDNVDGHHAEWRRAPRARSLNHPGRHAQAVPAVERPLFEISADAAATAQAPASTSGRA